MGYKIYVDHSRFSNGAKEIEEYIGTIDSYMASMNEEVESMSSFWEGEDSMAFNEKWNQLTNTGSVTANMKSDLKNYADNLNQAANKYKNAQINAINEANNLPRWW